MKYIVLLLSLTFGIAACSHDVEDKSSEEIVENFELPDPDEDTCGYKAALQYVGQPVDDVTFATENVRIERPNGLYTLDYRTDRLRVSVDETGVVVSVACG